MLTHEVKRNFSTKVCILAGSKSFDVHGATIMKSINKLSKEPVEFIGIGGPRMKEQGLQKSFTNVDEFLDKPFFPVKNFFPKYLESFIHPPTLPIKLRNYRILKKLQKDNFYEQIYDAKPDVVLTLGNEFFMNTVYQQLAALYDVKDTLRPAMTYYDSFIMNKLRRSQRYLDYVFYTCPKESVNWRGFTFPSTFIGKLSATNALAYLYKNSKDYQKLVNGDKIYVSDIHNQQLIESLVNEQKEKYRTEHNISEESTVFYCVPGNTPEEIKFALPLIHGSIKEFINKFSTGARAIATENFTLVITIDELNAKQIESFISGKKWPCKIILAKTEEEKYAAMAGSDMGLVINGDAVSECAMYQLPVVVVDPSGYFDTYLKLLYNSFSNDLSLARGGEIYPEVQDGQAHPGKILDIWSEWFLKPRLRFKYITRLEKFVPKIIPKPIDIADENKETKSREITINDNTFEERTFGDSLIAKKMLNATEAYKTLKTKSLKNFELPEARKTMLEEVNPNNYYLADDYKY